MTVVDETGEWWADKEAHSLLTGLAAGPAVASVTVRWQRRVDRPHPVSHEKVGEYFEMADGRVALAARRIWPGWTPGYVLHIQLVDGTEILGPWTERHVCCDMHDTHCEPPSELCCRYCTEVNHPRHSAFEPCVLEGEEVRS